MGQRFELDALRHLIEQRDYVCSAPLQHRLLRPSGEALLFTHALIRDAIYDSLLKARRRELHRRAAEWFAQRDLVLHAEHLDRAGDPAAAAAYGAAAQAEAAAYRNERALALVRRGLERSLKPAEQTRLACQEGDLCHDLGQMDGARAAYGRALDLAESDADRCPAWLGLAAVERIVEELDRSDTHLDRAEAAASTLGLKEHLARIHHLRGHLYFHRTRLDDCLSEHQRCLDLARNLGSDELQARALGGRGDAFYAQGRMASANEQFDRCVTLARKAGFGRIEVAYLFMRGGSNHFLNRAEAAWEDCRGAAELAQRVGDRRSEMIGCRFGGQVLHERGELEQSEEWIARAYAIARDLGARRFEPVCLMSFSRIAAQRGERGEACRLLRDAAAISRETSRTFVGASLLGALALFTESAEERREALEEGEAILRAGALSFNYFWFYRDAMEVALLGKDWAEVARFASALEVFVRTEPLPYTDFYLARARALAAYGQSRRDESLTRSLRRLREEARRARLSEALPALERALADAPQSDGDG